MKNPHRVEPGSLQHFLLIVCVAVQFLILPSVAFAMPGDLDPTFSNGGKLTDWSDGAMGVAIQPDGKIVVIGTDFPFDFRVARYNPDGTPDTTFGGGTGRVTTDLSEFDFPFKIAVQPDGKIIVAGTYGSGDSMGFALVRYNPNGSLDTGFGGGSGKVLTSTWDPCSRFYYPYADVAIQSDGKIVGGVGYGDYNGDCLPHGLVFRYHSDGSLDTSFFNSGSVYTEFEWWRIALQPADSKIVLGGPDRIARFNTNGTPDTGFGSGGSVPLPINQSRNTTALALSIQSDGKIVVALPENGMNDFGVVRYQPNGSLDTTFDGDGIVSTPIGFADTASSVAIQSDRKIVVAGTSANGLNNDFAVVRYMPNGLLDSTFGGGDGIITSDFDISNDKAYGIALDNVGRAVVVGASNERFAIARVLLGPASTPFDFDGDGRSDVSVFRPSDTNWYLDRSQAGFSGRQFGISTDRITPADYDGDGRTDISVYRDGVWYWLDSMSGGFHALQFGLAGDTPAPADYNGDGRAELAVYRDGQWWTFNLSNNQASLFNFGSPGDKPVPADYDGDGLVDQAVYRHGVWHLNRSTQGYAAVAFGLPSDRPVVGDYDGDGKSDLAVYRDGTWYLQESTQGFVAVQWGIATDTPIPADYEGDGKTDIAVYRDGTWYLLQSTAGFAGHQFGLAGDRPIPAAFGIN